MNINDFSQKPNAWQIYAKNEVPAFVISTGDTLLATLSIGGATIYQGSYSPDFNGQITIDFKGVYDAYLSTMIPSAAVNEITHNEYIKQFTATFYELDGESTTGDPASISWKVANAKLNSATPFNTWCESNFLTNQPLEKVTNYESPEWLTWIGKTGRKYTTLKVRFYPKAGGNVDAVVCTNYIDNTDGCFSANVRYSRIIQLANVVASRLNGYYDLILFDDHGDEMCRQRYIYEERSGREKYFLFVNALGGIDTLICDGENVLQPDTTHNIGRFDDHFRALDDTDEQRMWTQNTGLMPNKYRNWVYELLTEKQGAQKYDPEAMDYYEIVVASSEISMSDHGQLAEASFAYILNDTDDVMIDTERSVDRSLHQSVADEAEEMRDDIQEMELVMQIRQNKCVETEEVLINATTLHVEFTLPLAAESGTPIYYYTGHLPDGSFTPEAGENSLVITKPANYDIYFATDLDDYSYQGLKLRIWWR